MQETSHLGVDAPNWVCNLLTLWRARATVTRVSAIALAASLGIVFLIPKMYTSEARIMPPESGNASSSLVAMLAGRGFGSDSLGGLAAALMGNHASGALFIDLLRSGTVTGHLVERFHLKDEYGKRYNVDAVKVLLRRTVISEDKKSGVITVSVRDHDPAKAQEMVKAYLDELNTLTTQTSSSPAHQERLFLQDRLATSRAELSKAQQALSDFSSANAAIDLREQTRATVESQARVQGELIATQAQLRSVEQIYGDQNVRVRGLRARIASLGAELTEMGGTSGALLTSASSDTKKSYLPLRQVPRLAVPYANLVREVHVQETVYDLLTQQYEMSRIQEAKDVPVVNVIDPPGIPEKKSFPPRTLLVFALTFGAFLIACMYVLIRQAYTTLHAQDSRKALAAEVQRDMAATIARVRRR